jgi:light-regulated signal transduction histidine kinase (bacteriophytochrome)
MLALAACGTSPAYGTSGLRLVEELASRAALSIASARGASLGLAITKGIVEAHGGHISAESTAGRGSTSFFTVPVAVAGEPLGAAPYASPRPSATSG